MAYTSGQYAGKTTPLRTAAVLTTSYVSSNSVKTDRVNQAVLYVSLTFAALTSAEIKVWFSNDNSTFYQEGSQTISGATITENLALHQFGATGTYRIAVPILDKYMKVTCHGTGTCTSSSMTVDVVLGDA